MAGTMVVMVLDQDDPNRGEIRMIQDTGEAARLAEHLIESGVEVERIRVFDAMELSMKVSHKPVVSLGADEGTYEQASLEDEDLAPVAVLSGGGSDDFSEDDQSLSEEPLTRNGVRFSSLFKSDDF